MQVDGLRLAESPWGMNSLHGFILPFFLCTQMALAAGDDDYKPGPDSLPQPGVPKGEMVKDKYTAKDSSFFPGTEREYQIYMPAGLDASKPAPFMVFQDGVIYQAPVVFDNLIAKKEIPPLIGIFIKPGVVPAANENALPRFNRSYEYDSVTDTYSRFLIEEFLPAIKAKHKLKLSEDPNARGIAGSSSGGICAFMVAWHRPDQFRRVFTSVGTYVGIHGADQLAVLVRKHEPKPLRIHLQSGEGDNNLYCGDWWMANQMMERSLTWNGYDVSHTWGTGGHNQKHATAIFPDVLRGLWKGYPEEPVKANPRGDAKWRGYEVVGGADTWRQINNVVVAESLCPVSTGEVYFLALEDYSDTSPKLGRIKVGHEAEIICSLPKSVGALAQGQNGNLICASPSGICYIKRDGTVISESPLGHTERLLLRFDGTGIAAINGKLVTLTEGTIKGDASTPYGVDTFVNIWCMAVSPDQTQLYVGGRSSSVDAIRIGTDGVLEKPQSFHLLHTEVGNETHPSGLCVDTNGWLYVATSLGIQVLDQAGRVNFIIPTPKQPHDVCFGGKDLSELFIACGDAIYKRPTKAKGYISGQMAPIKPPPPKL